MAREKVQYKRLVMMLGSTADCVRYLLLSSFLKGEKRDLLLAGENGNY